MGPLPLSEGCVAFAGSPLAKSKSVPGVGGFPDLEQEDKVPEAQRGRPRGHRSVTGRGMDRVPLGAYLQLQELDLANSPGVWGRTPCRQGLALSPGFPPCEASRP